MVYADSNAHITACALAGCLVSAWRMLLLLLLDIGTWWVVVVAVADATGHPRVMRKGMAIHLNMLRAWPFGLRMQNHWLGLSWHWGPEQGMVASAEHLLVWPPHGSGLAVYLARCVPGSKGLVHLAAAAAG